MMRKLPCWQPKRQFLPFQSRIDKQKNYLERVSKETEADQELEAANAKQIQAKQEMPLLVAEQSAENAKTVNQRNPGFSLTCQDTL